VQTGFPVSGQQGQAAGQQRVAVITGAGTGIGAAVTRRLAADGAAVVLVGRRQRPLHDVAAQLGERALAVAADAASADGMAGVVEAARTRFGPPRPTRSPRWWRSWPAARRPR
jgi:NADP-dependent 3-hydroxy acid dehydrogenase YdfG